MTDVKKNLAVGLGSDELHTLGYGLFVPSRVQSKIPRRAHHFSNDVAFLSMYEYLVFIREVKMHVISDVT